LPVIAFSLEDMDFHKIGTEKNSEFPPVIREEFKRPFYFDPTANLFQPTQYKGNKRISFMLFS